MELIDGLQMAFDILITIAFVFMVNTLNKIKNQLKKIKVKVR